MLSDGGVLYKIGVFDITLLFHIEVFGIRYAKVISDYFVKIDKEKSVIRLKDLIQNRFCWYHIVVFNIRKGLYIRLFHLNWQRKSGVIILRDLV